MLKNLTIAVLVASIAAGGAIAIAQSPHTVETTASVEVRVWRNVADAERLHLSTRPAGGRWTTHNTRLVMERAPSGNWDQSDFVTVDVPITVEVEAGGEEPAPQVATVSLTFEDQFFTYSGDYRGLGGTITSDLGAGEFDIDVYLSTDRGTTWTADCTNSDVVIPNVEADLFCDDLRVEHITAVRVVNTGVSFEPVDDVHYRCEGAEGSWSCTPLQ